jgi:hypothetical protein
MQGTPWENLPVRGAEQGLLLEPQCKKGAAAIPEAKASIEGLGAVPGHDLKMKGITAHLPSQADQRIQDRAPKPLAPLRGDDVEVVQENVTPSELHRIAKAQHGVADRTGRTLNLEHKAVGLVSQQLHEGTLALVAEGMAIFSMEGLCQAEDDRRICSIRDSEATTGDIRH